MNPCIIMRCRNDMPIIAETLAMVKRQRMESRLIVLDNGSTDGTLEEVAKYTDNIVAVPHYVPGPVLNQGMAAAEGEYVVFLNSDCTPQNDRWLENLLAGFDSDNVAAVFGRQVPRPGCWPLYARDTEATFGDGRLQQYWRHCFSMASSAIRRSVWQDMKFSETLQYSEDVDWTWRARQRGHEIRYVKDSVVAHSHNYTWREYYRRQYGEGKADAMIFDWLAWQRSWFRFSLLPYGRQILSDCKYCLKRGRLLWALYSPYLRSAQLLGRRAGFNAGWRERTA